MAAVCCCCCCIIAKIWPCLAASCCYCCFFKASSSAQNSFSFPVFSFKNFTAPFPLHCHLVCFPLSPSASDIFFVCPNRSMASFHIFSAVCLPASIFFRAYLESLDSAASFSHSIISSIKVSSSVRLSTAMPLTTTNLHIIQENFFEKDSWRFYRCKPFYIKWFCVQKVHVNRLQIDTSQ